MIGDVVSCPDNHLEAPRLLVALCQAPANALVPAKRLK
jgi:hypothetical protein